MITDDLAPLCYDVEPWFMSGFEFRCVWEALGLDHLPFPLAYRNRQEYMVEVEADTRAALTRLRADLTENRVRILEALRFPAFMVLGFGRIENGAGEQLYRLFGVVGTTGYCAVITQDPSEQTIFGGDIQITGCVNVDFPQVVLEALPKYPPGTKPRKDARLEDETPAPFFRESTITASILLAGSADFTLDYELQNANHLTLVNIADDGAYLVNEGTNAFQIIPATVSNLLNVFRKVASTEIDSRFLGKDAEGNYKNAYWTQEQLDEVVGTKAAGWFVGANMFCGEGKSVSSVIWALRRAVEVAGDGLVVRLTTSRTFLASKGFGDFLKATKDFDYRVDIHYMTDADATWPKPRKDRATLIVMDSDTERFAGLKSNRARKAPTCTTRSMSRRSGAAGGDDSVSGSGYPRVPRR